MASNMYITFDGIEGGSTSAVHDKQIEILSWNHGFTQPTSPVRSAAGSGTVEDCTHQNFTFSKYVDSATDDLLKMCWTGKQIASATVTCYRSGGDTANNQVEYLKVEMQHIIVSNFSISGGPGDVPVENISLDYGIIKYTYLPQKREDGTGGSQQAIQHNLETRTVS
jgi:type VI secretion system secreted protein Hcp